MNEKILLINAPFQYLVRLQTPPLGLINLSTILENYGFNVKLLDVAAEKPYRNDFISEPLSPIEFLQKYKQYDPDIIGISSYTENYSIAMQIVRMCKAENPNLKVIYGGIHATFQAANCLLNNSSLDVVTIGESEHIITDLIKGLLGKTALNEVNNLVFRENGIIKHSSANTLPDLSELAPPNLDFIKKKYYPSFALQVEFSRGCPFHCVFCCLSPFTRNKVRYFSTSRVIHILESYQEQFGNFSFFFNDPTFLFSHKKVLHFLEEVRKRKLELNNWHFETRSDTISRDILRELKKSNAQVVNIGIEDIHDTVLKMIDKKQSFDQIKRAIKIIKEIGLETQANFIIGLPSQTKNHMLDNISYSSNVDHITFPCVTPFPGTPLFNTPEKYGLTILSKNWSLYTYQDILMNSLVFPVEQQQEIRDIAWCQRAQRYLNEESTFYFIRKEYERLIELGYDTWYEDWKKKYNSGWIKPSIQN